MTTTKQIQILIVDDSQISRDLLAYIIQSDPHLKVAGTASNGVEALDFIKKQTPDVVITDLVMPKMDGFELIRTIIKTNPLPIIVISGAYSTEEVSKAFKALSTGALTILAKPQGVGDKQFIETARFVVETIKAISKVKMNKGLFRQLFQPTGTSKLDAIALELRASSRKMEPDAQQTIKAIAIGAELGGPQALSTILSTLSPHLPVPIFIAQHLSSGFSQGLATWLSEAGFLKVQVAKNGDVAKPGVVYICPDQSFMEIAQDYQIVVSTKPSEGSSSCIGRLFSSMATTFGNAGVGILLTGAGRDGPRELAFMKERGAITIVQDEASCVKEDLCKEAIKIGAARHVIALAKIGPTLEQMLHLTIKSMSKN